MKTLDPASRLGAYLTGLLVGSAARSPEQEDVQSERAAAIEELELQARQVEIAKQRDELVDKKTSRRLAVLLVGLLAVVALTAAVCAVLGTGNFRIFAAAGSPLAAALAAVLYGFRSGPRPPPPSGER